MQIQRFRGTGPLSGLAIRSFICCFITPVRVDAGRLRLYPEFQLGNQFSHVDGRMPDSCSQIVQIGLKLLFIQRHDMVDCSIASRRCSASDRIEKIDRGCEFSGWIVIGSGFRQGKRKNPDLERNGADCCSIFRQTDLRRVESRFISGVCFSASADCALRRLQIQRLKLLRIIDGNSSQSDSPF